MTFFYDLNKKIAALAGTQLNEGKSAKPDFLDVDKDGDKKEPFKKAVKDKELDEASYSATSARAGKDIGKPGKAFGKIAADAAERYGSKEKGEKVAGAMLKKLRAKTNEADMEEGNEFSGALVKAKAAGAKSFEVDGKEYPVKEAKAKSKNEPAKKNAFDPEVARSMFSPEKGKTKTGHDVKDTGYSKRYTKSLKDEPEDSDDDTPKTKGRKTVGAGKGKKIGAKVKGTSKLHSKGALAEGENTAELVKNASYMLGSLVGRSKRGETIPPKELAIQLDQIFKMVSQVMGSLSNPVQKGAIAENDHDAEYGQEGDMAKDDLKSAVLAAKELHSILGDNQDLPEWVQSKITKALDYLNASNQYMQREKDDMGDEVVAEKAVSQQQQKFMGMAHAMQKGEKIKGASPELKKVAKTMKKSDVKDFAATKHEGLPKKVKEEDTAEAPKKSKGGIQFGKGVYEAMNDNLESLITESMNVNVSMSTNDAGEPTKSITVSAEGEQAEMLAQLLNLAGLQGKAEACPSCGSTPCGCDQVDEAVDENNPDWPTDEETTGNDDPQQRRWAGGLNGPKSTGQTTGAPFNRQPERQGHMAEATDLGLNLYAELKSFKAK